MSMLFRKVVSVCLFICPLSTIQATSYTWNGLGSSGSNLNTASNWSPEAVPGAADNAIFDSSVSGINTSPIDASTFDINTFQFPNSAEAFSFTFTNSLLQLNGPGSITGTNTNPTITCNNTNNSTPLNNQILFNNGTSNSTGSGTFTVNNTGSLSGSSSGASVSYVENSQIRVPSGSSTFTIPNEATFVTTNSGTNTTNGGASNSVGYVTSGALEIDNDLTIGNNVTISMSNTGLEDASNTSNNRTGSLGYFIETSGNSVTIGNDVTINLSNTGTISGSGSSEYVANISNNFVDFHAVSAVIGNDFTLNATNIATDSTSGSGVNYSAYLEENGLYFDTESTFGTNATISFQNKGTCSSTSGNNGVAYMEATQIQCYGSLTADDNFSLTSINEGIDNSTETGGNYIGFNGDGYQLYIEGDVNLSNDATITVSNSGTSAGSASSPNNVGYVGYSQAMFYGTFTAEDNLSITTTNTGVDNGIGSGGNTVGYVDEYGQLYFDGVVNIGNNTTITASNSGINSNSGAPGSTGRIRGDQISSQYAFTTGTDLTITATNDGINTGNMSSIVGYVDGSQINFYNTCSLKDGTVLSATNSGAGTITGPQINFQEGFTLDGKATFKAINSSEGHIGGGISIASGSGGDVDIILSNSELSITSGESIFTIGALNGDSGSTVNAAHSLTINADSGVAANFSGAIQTTSGLNISGLGSQKLSGTNTFTELTTVEDNGTLVLTGSLAGNLNVNGLLKGTGSVFGAVSNIGTISPGQSIGTINFLGGFTNSGGGYNVEVDETTSDLINVTGTATIDGGRVTVSSADGEYLFNHRYTILTASTAVSGGYASVTAVSPFITPTLSQDANHIYLSLATDILSGAETANQIAIAQQLDNISSPTAEQSVLLSAIVGLSESGVQGALNSLDGYQHTTDLMTSAMVNREFIRRLYDPLRPIVTSDPRCHCIPCNELTSWLEAGGNHACISGNKNAYGVRLNGYEITAGLQQRFYRDWTVGLACSYDYEHFHFNQNGGSGGSRTWLVGLYGLYRPSAFYGFVDFAYGYSNNFLDRIISAGGVSYTAESKPKVSQFTFYGEIGFDMHLACVLVQPFLGIEAESYHRNSLSESYAGGWGLNVNKRNFGGACGRLGAHVTTAYKCVDISLDVACDQQFNSINNAVFESFETIGDQFTIVGTALNQTSIDYALTLSSQIDPNWRVYLEGSGESWSHANECNLLAGVTYSW